MAKFIKVIDSWVNLDHVCEMAVIPDENCLKYWVVYWKNEDQPEDFSHLLAGEFEDEETANRALQEFLEQHDLVC